MADVSDWQNPKVGFASVNLIWVWKVNLSAGAPHWSRCTEVV